MAADDREWLVTLAQATGQTVFTARDLAKHRRVDPHLRQLLHGLNVPDIGYRLRRLSGRVYDGLVLQKVVKTKRGMEWTVTMVSDRHRDAGLRP